MTYPDILSRLLCGGVGGMAGEESMKKADEGAKAQGSMLKGAFRKRLGLTADAPVAEEAAALKKHRGTCADGGEWTR